MVSTVSTTISTAINSIAVMGLTGAVIIAAVTLLVSFLITKELSVASQSHSSRLVARFLNVGIVPLVMVFAVVVAVKILETLG